MTAHTTIQSSQTAHFVGDSKEAVSAGISPVSSPGFLSPWTSAVFRADFWPPVSASKNSVPGKLDFEGQRPFGGLEIDKNAVSSRGRNYCGFSPSASNGRLHSAAASRSRSNLMPRGRQPSTAVSDEIRCEERERNRHIDLTHTAFLAYRDLLDANHRARYDLVKSATASCSRTERFELSELREGGLTC